MITITTYLKNSESFLSDICFNQNKNKLCSLHSPAFFKILKEPALLQKQTVPHMKALLFSFLELEEQGHGIIMGAPSPHPLHFCTFSFRCHGGQVRLMKQRLNVLYQIYLSQDPQNYCFLTRMAFKNEQLFIWNASIWVQWPCTYFPLRLCMWKCCYLYTYTYNIIICTLVVIYVSKNTCTPSKLQLTNFQKVSFCLTFYRRIETDILHDSIVL